MYTLRPSSRELYKKLEEAKTALEERQGLFANPAKVVGELEALEIEDTAQVWNLIRELLEEILVEHYAGARPPMKAYEEAIANQELFAFSWWSKKMGKEMYLKFALKNGRYYYVSLHKSRLAKQEKDHGMLKLCREKIYEDTPAVLS